MTYIQTIYTGMGRAIYQPHLCGDRSGSGRSVWRCFCNVCSLRPPSCLLQTKVTAVLRLPNKSTWISSVGAVFLSDCVDRIVPNNNLGITHLNSFQYVVYFRTTSSRFKSFIPESLLDRSHVMPVIRFLVITHFLKVRVVNNGWRPTARLNNKPQKM